MDSPIKAGASQFPDAPYLVQSNAVRHARACYHLALRYCHHLKKLGIQEGVHVAIAAPATPDTILILHSIWHMGAVGVLLNTRFPDDVLCSQVTDTQCQWVISAQSRKWPIPVNVISLDQMVHRATAIPRHKPDIWPTCSHSNPATIIFTSGSTSRPKPVVHSLRNHIASATAANMNSPIAPGDRWLLNLPLYHVAGLSILMRTLISGAAVVLPDTGQTLSETITRHSMTHLSLVTTQLQQLCNEHTSNLDCLKAVLLGGSPFPKALLNKARALGLPIQLSYGSTESASQVSATKPGAPLKSSVSAGRALSHVSIHIHSDNEILLKGTSLALGYWQQGHVTPLLGKDGWYHTGDLGQIRNGELEIIGRKDNAFFSGGENVQPELIEKALTQIHPITDAMVVPVAHPRYGNAPCAFIRGHGDWQQMVENCKRVLASRLPKYMQPVKYHPWPDPFPNSRIKPSRKKFEKLAGKPEL